MAACDTVCVKTEPVNFIEDEPDLIPEDCPVTVDDILPVKTEPKSSFEYEPNLMMNESLGDAAGALSVKEESQESRDSTCSSCSSSGAQWMNPEIGSPARESICVKTEPYNISSLALLCSHEDGDDCLTDDSLGMEDESGASTFRQRQEDPREGFSSSSGSLIERSIHASDLTSVDRDLGAKTEQNVAEREITKATCSTVHIKAEQPSDTEDKLDSVTGDWAGPRIASVALSFREDPQESRDSMCSSCSSLNVQLMGCPELASVDSDIEVRSGPIAEKGTKSVAEARLYKQGPNECGESSSSTSPNIHRIRASSLTNVGETKSRHVAEQGDSSTTSEPRRSKRRSKLEKLYRCDVCSATFPCWKDFKEHAGEHLEDKPYKCELCPAEYGNRWSLRYHKKTHCRQKPYTCDLCPAAFNTSSMLQTHMRLHSTGKPYPCEYCPAGFKASSSLRNHVRLHTGERPYACESCPAKFITARALLLHRRRHTGDMPYACNFCQAKFVERGGLTRHLRIHTGERPFVCKVCSAKFPESGRLTCHMRTHTGEKPYICKICSMAFTRFGDLKRHMVVKHPGEAVVKYDARSAGLPRASGPQSRSFRDFVC